MTDQLTSNSSDDLRKLLREAVKIIHSGQRNLNKDWLMRARAALKQPAHETRPCAERQDAYDAAAESRVRAINRDAERYRVVRVSKLISESIAPWDLDAACDGWIAARDSQKATAETSKAPFGTCPDCQEPITSFHNINGCPAQKAGEGRPS